MRIAIILLGVLLLPVSLAAQSGFVPEAQLVRLKGYRDRVRLDTTIIWKQVNGPPATTMRNLVAVLDSLQVPVEVADSTKGRLHHSGFVVRTRLAGMPISHSFRCGTGLAGDYADTWRVNVAYVAYVLPDGTRSLVGLGSAAGASDIEGASKPAVPCATTGGLLKELTRILEQKSLQ